MLKLPANFEPCRLITDFNLIIVDLNCHKIIDLCENMNEQAQGQAAAGRSRTKATGTVFSYTMPKMDFYYSTSPFS